MFVVSSNDVIGEVPGLQSVAIEIGTPYLRSASTGGRCFSLGGTFGGSVTFPGQVAERGGEFIDTGHKTMLAYANEFNLAKEDVNKEPGEVLYYFDGQHVPEEDVVDEYRDFVDAMHDDLQDSSGAPTADDHNDADVILDNTTLEEYLITRGAGPIIFEAIKQSYIAEYGREIDEQSALNFLLFIHADKRSKFTPFGVFSDERYHVIGGNQQIPAGLAAGLGGQIRYGAKLQRARKTAAGRIELTFGRGASTVSATHDAVVLAIPFSVLREVQLDASLGLPAWKLFAIQNLAYGTNAKMMLGFNGPIWSGLGSNGQSFSDLTNHQNTWETNPSRATCPPCAPPASRPRSVRTKSRAPHCPSTTSGSATTTMSSLPTTAAFSSSARASTRRRRSW